MKATVFGVLEDLRFEISEGSDHNRRCPESAQLAVSAKPESAQLAVSAKLRQPTGQTQDNFILVQDF